MKNLDRFMKEGKIERSRVSMAIASGELTRGEIIELCQDPRMKTAFIGTSYSPKRLKERWNKDYLDELVCAAVAESFNEDYLLYLNNVAEAVRSKKNGKLTLLLGIIKRVAAVVVSKVRRKANQHCF